MGEQAVGLLNALGYARVRHYRGGLADWKQNGGPIERRDGAPPDSRSDATGKAAPAAAPSAHGRDLRQAMLDLVGRCTIGQLLAGWLWMIAGFGLFYWAAGAAGGEGLQSGGRPVGAGAGALLDALYFSFVTALSIGYGDVVPVGPVRALAVIEGAAGLLIFGCVISKLVSRRQDDLIEQTHRIAFEDRLGRVRTNLHLVLSEIETLARRCADPAEPPERVRTRVESAATVFAGELQAIHDLLYRPQQIPDETVLEAILANVASGLREMNELMACNASLPDGSKVLKATLREMANLGSEICGECVPRQYAPQLKEWMDQIQEQSRRMA